MIKYTLKCARDHRFESWFQSAEAFDTLARGKMLSCAVCGDDEVTKSVMAPQISQGREDPAPASTGTEAQDPAQAKAQARLAALKKHVETNSDYVGSNFAHEARAMHDGTAPGRSIYGEANLSEAKSLIDDGVPVLPLPFLPARKVN